VNPRKYHTRERKVPREPGVKQYFRKCDVAHRRMEAPPVELMRNKVILRRRAFRHVYYYFSDLYPGSKFGTGAEDHER
jgi:hypothetical protein